jgi:hypothetical protein
MQRKCKIVKLNEPKIQKTKIGEYEYEITITHKCESCECVFGDGKLVGQRNEIVRDK